jgi:hypothetical protein
MLHHTPRELEQRYSCVVLSAIERLHMWFLVSVIKSNRYFESESHIGNRLLLSDTTDMIICGRAHSESCYRFEARKGNESFTLAEFRGIQAPGVLTTRFLGLAQQFGAIVALPDAHVAAA